MGKLQGSITIYQDTFSFFVKYQDAAYTEISYAIEEEYSEYNVMDEVDDLVYQWYNEYKIKLWKNIQREAQHGRQCIKTI